jgi:hypothetical protein
MLLYLRIFDNNKGLLLEVNTANFNTTGNTQIFSGASISQLMPFVYTYSGSSTLNDISKRGGLFPAGDYRFDYTFYGSQQGAQTKLADASVNHSVIMPAFLQLISVFDKDTLKDEHPTFMWLPASATRTVGSYETEREYKLTYIISVAEILTNQTPYMAITSNPMFFHQEGLETTLVTYPFSARKFEPCKNYAWQVRGVINGQTVISSEVWTFSTPCKKIEIVPDAAVLVKQNPDQTYCTVQNDIVSFSYYEEYDTKVGQILNIELFDEKGKKIKTPDELNLIVKRGLNTYNVTVCPQGFDLGEGFSQLVITNSRNEKWYLRIYNNQKVNNCY